MATLNHYVHATYTLRVDLAPDEVFPFAHWGHKGFVSAVSFNTDGSVDVVFHRARKDGQPHKTGSSHYVGSPESLPKWLQEIGEAHAAVVAKLRELTVAATPATAEVHP